MTMEFFDEHEKKVHETDRYEFYKNDLTRDCTKKARAMDIHGMELKGWTVLKVVDKTDEKHFYVIYDDEGEPYHDTSSIWEMYDWIKIKKMMMSYDYNIVDMAEKVNKKKKKEDKE